MLEFLAQMIGSIGAAFIGMSSHSVEPNVCSYRGDIQYCYYQGAAQSDKVVYFMHGFGNDVRGWTVNTVTGWIEEEWGKNKVERPHIVTLSRGVWWYTEARQGEALTEFTQWFESQYLGFTPRRVLYGDSMGGHNAYRWSLDQPQLFSKVALICPAFPRSFVDRPNNPSQGVAAWEYLAEQLVREYYKKSTNPQFNPLKVQNYFIPHVYLAVTDKDDFGFYSGGLALKNLMATFPGVTLEFETQSVRHCDVEAQKLAQFLVAF